MTPEDDLKGGVVQNVSELSDTETIDSKIKKLPTDDSDDSVWVDDVDFVDNYNIAISGTADNVRLYSLYPNNGDVLL